MQDRHVLRDKKKSKGEHPEAEEGQEAEDAPENECPRDDDPDPEFGWLPQPANESPDFHGHSTLDQCEVSVQPNRDGSHAKSDSREC